MEKSFKESSIIYQGGSFMTHQTNEELREKGFKDVPGYEGYYAISKSGEIYSYPNKRHDGKLIKQGFNGNGYLIVTLCRNGKRTLATHQIMGMTYLGKRKKGYDINHKNGVRTDNRLENLEYCTRFQNNCFCGPKKNSTSKYKGVSKDGNRWRSKIYVGGKVCHIGSFGSEIEAAKAYDRGAIKFHKKHAWLNKDHFNLKVVNEEKE